MGTNIQFAESLFNDTGYDPTNCSSLHHFSHIKNNIECPFAKRSKLWGSPDWVSTKSLEDNVEALTQSLNNFVIVSALEKLDGYVIAAPEEYGASLENLSKFTKEVLTHLNSLDPALSKIMDQDIGHSNWQFSYGGIKFFVITFGTCYPKSNSRYTWNSDQTYIFLQPEHSFESANIPKGSAIQIRKSIRAAFKNNQREYYDSKIIDAPSEAIKYVKPMKLGDWHIEWWKEKI